MVRNIFNFKLFKCLYWECFLIDELIEAGIEPWITLYHWDLPAALEFEIDGWIGDEISDIFCNYADICFDNFGDRVKNWITINEAWVVAILGYGHGVFAQVKNQRRCLI